MTFLSAYLAVVAAIFALAVVVRSVRLTAVLAALCMAVAYVSGASLLGWPKPALMQAFGGADDVAVIGQYYVEGEAIWIWVMEPGASEPRAYSLPWDTAEAQKMMQAAREAESGGTQLILSDPFGEREFHAAPQPPMPEKGATE